MRFTITILLLILTLQLGNLHAQEVVNKYKAKGAGVALYSPDKALLAIADGKKIHLYTTGTKTKVFDFKALNRDITSLAFSLDSKYIIVGGYGRKVRILDAKTGEVLQKVKVDDRYFRYPDQIIRCITPIDNTTIALVVHKKLLLMRLADGKIIWEKEFSRPLRALAVDLKENKILVSGGSRSLISVSIDNPQDTAKLWSGKSWVSSLSIQPEGNYVAIGDYKGVVYLYDRENKSVIAKFTQFSDVIKDLAFSGDGKYLGVAARNGEAKIYSFEQKRFSIELKRPGRLLNALDFNLNGEELVSAGVNSKPRTYDIRPLNITPVYKLKDDSDNTAPQIYVSNPPNIKNDRFRYSKGFIKLQGNVMDESGISQVKVNDIKVPIKENGKFVINLPLQMGDNYVTIEALDINDNTALKKFVINRKDLDGNEYVAADAKNYLFVVGIDDYKEWPHLNNAVRDANAVVEVLMSNYNFQFSNVTVIKNEQATRSNIYNGLRSLIEKISPQDNLMIYYSGHGHFDELLNEGYWVPVDAKTDNTGNYLSNSDILKVISNINSQHTFLVADACFSGSLFAETSRGYTENVEKYKSRWGLASGRLETVSDGAYGENSPFASAFIDFMRNNDKESLAVSEIVQHVKITVAENENQTPLGNPLKGTGDEGGEFIFYKK